MKRLKKNANNKYNNFLDALLNENSVVTSVAQQCINENQDCLYTGKAYRVLYFSKETLKERINNFDDYEDEHEAIESLITVNNTISSFSKTREGVENYMSHQQDYEGIPVIISTNLNDALDIEKFYNKYEDQLTEEVKSSYEYYSVEQEVLGYLSNSFDIENVEDVGYETFQ